MRAERKVASVSLSKPITSRGFPRKYRLTEKHEYDRILKSRVAAHARCGCFRVLSMQSETAGTRLGLIVGKRQLKRAVDRNRVKRMVRESFRIARMDLASVDIVVQLISPPNAHLRRDVAAIWEHLKTTGSPNAA